MGDTISSDASAMDADSQEATEEASAAQDAQPADNQPGTTGLSGSTASRIRHLLGTTRHSGYEA